jgi:hypothetical protein
MGAGSLVLGFMHREVARFVPRVGAVISMGWNGAIGGSAQRRRRAAARACGGRGVSSLLRPRDRLFLLCFWGFARAATLLLHGRFDAADDR